MTSLGKRPIVHNHQKDGNDYMETRLNVNVGTINVGNINICNISVANTDRGKIGIGSTGVKS